MRDFINIGSTPTSEDCLSVGQAFARQECLIYARQLKREFPEGDFQVKGFEHDFGRYYEVVAYFDENNEAEREAAFNAESKESEFWDAQAQAELVRFKIPI